MSAHERSIELNEPDPPCWLGKRRCDEEVTSLTTVETVGCSTFENTKIGRYGGCRRETNSGQRREQCCPRTDVPEVAT